MQERRGFSLEKDGLGIWRRQEKRFIDRFTDEDIDKAWETAYEKIGKFVIPEERG